MKISDFKLVVARKKILLSAAGGNEAPDQRPKIGVILDTLEDDHLRHFRELGKDLHIEDEDMSLVICTTKTALREYSDFPVISLKSFGWKGDVGPEVSAFLDKKYDLVVCFTQEGNKVSDFLVRMSDAKLKVGRGQKNDSGIFDLNIFADPGSPEIFTDELKKYLPHLNIRI